MLQTSAASRSVDYLLHHYLGRVAADTPDKVAVVDGGRRLTYLELDEWSNRLAHLLVELGTRMNDRVGLYLPKSAEAIVGIYGVLKAGAAYVPLDPLAPPTRLAGMARDAGMRVLLTSAQKAMEWRLVAGGGGPTHVVVLDATSCPDELIPQGVSVSTLADLDAEPSVAPDTCTIHDDLAYVLYTSGSTGRPKGVMLTHLNASTFVDWAVAQFGLKSSDRFSSHAPLHFDLSVFDIFAAAKAGGTVVLVPQETSVFPVQLARFIRDSELTVWYSVPSILSLMVQRGGLKPGCLPTLRLLLFAGEVFPTRSLRQLMGFLPGVRFVNLYGPTETNVCTWYDVPPLSPECNDPIPIGRAIDNVHVFALKSDGRLAGQGEVGELHVRGSTVMQGYWGDPERSAKGLVADPFSPGPGCLAYRTGDLVQELPSGDYRLIGRRDHQVKCRGYRIELGEIEAALYAHPGVREAAVIAEPHEVFTNTLTAFVATDPSVEQHALAKFLAERLPAYMIPDTFHFRSALPRTSTGKVNRQELSSRPEVEVAVS